MISSLLVFQYGQARIWFAMSRDGLLPEHLFARCTRVYKTPHVSTWIAGFVVGIPAGIWDIGTFADLSNIGTLFAFIVVSAGRDRAAQDAAGPAARLPRALGVRCCRCFRSSSAWC